MARLDPLPRRTWRRLERRATRAHERDLLSTVRQLITMAAPIDQLEVDAAGIGAVVLRLGDHRLTMGGIAAPARLQLQHTITGDGPVLVSAAGRYNRLWWINLVGPAGSMTVLAARLRVVAAHGGLDSFTGATNVSPDDARSCTVTRLLTAPG